MTMRSGVLATGTVLDRILARTAVDVEIRASELPEAPGPDNRVEEDAR